MPDKNLTDNEIKKALECCGKQFDCVFCECVENCPQDTNKLNGLALDLINRQEEEMEGLRATIDSFADIGKLYSEIKAEAYRECMARVEERLSHKLSPELLKYIHDDLQDELNKMVGDKT